MSNPITRLNAALEGRYSIEPEIGAEGGYHPSAPKDLPLRRESP